MSESIISGGMVEINVDGRTIKAGCNTIKSEKQIAYLPWNTFRHVVGHRLNVDDVPHRIIDVRQSDLVPKMVVIIVKEFIDGEA